MDELSNRKQKALFLVRGSTADLIKLVQEEIVDDCIDLFFLHCERFDEGEELVMGHGCFFACDLWQWSVADCVVGEVVVSDLEDCVEELVGGDQKLQVWVL